MNTKKNPAPQAAQEENSTSYIVPSTSQPTCLHCRYWSMWDGSCATRAAALDDFSPVNPDTPACKEFQPE